MLQKKIIHAAEVIIKYPFKYHTLQDQLIKIFELFKATKKDKHSVPIQQQVIWLQGFVYTCTSKSKDIYWSFAVLKHSIEKENFYRPSLQEHQDFIEWIRTTTHFDSLYLLHTIQLLGILESYEPLALATIYGFPDTNQSNKRKANIPGARLTFKNSEPLTSATILKFPDTNQAKNRRAGMPDAKQQIEYLENHLIN